MTLLETKLIAPYFLIFLISLFEIWLVYHLSEARLILPEMFAVDTIDFYK